MVPMRHLVRRWPVLVVLAAWVLLGPIGMAFDSCAAMMVLCDGGPCGVVAAVTLAVPIVAPPTTLRTTEATTFDLLRVAVVRALDPPPKSLSRFA
jgi:hypothetical protein